MDTNIITSPIYSFMPGNIYHVPKSSEEITVANGYPEWVVTFRAVLFLVVIIGIIIFIIKEA